MKDYVVGFGDPSKEFWLGLDKLESLTEEGAELLIELETFEVIEAMIRKVSVMSFFIYSG